MAALIPRPRNAAAHPARTRLPRTGRPPRHAARAFPRHPVAALLLVAGLAACGGGSVPSDGPSDGDIQPKGAGAPLTQAEFNNLPPAEQYAVANKLLGTLWHGVTVEAFFDLSRGLDPPRPRHDDFLARTRIDLSTRLAQSRREAVNAEIFGIDDEGNRDPELAKYAIDNDELAKQEPLARIVDYPVSADMFSVWMAHFLANTIMFSPALEMESTNINDAQRIVASLERRIADGDSVTSIVRGHLPTLSRWRVSRSPENHALEAFELYLGLFDTAEDSRRGGIACQDFFLTPEDEGYELVQTPFANSQPVVILDRYFITRCSDLYDAVVSDPRFMPRVVEVIASYLLAGRSAEDRLAMVRSIVEAGPETFDDIFKAILFSREYLLGTERVQGFDENLFGTLARLKWSAYTDRDDIDDRIFQNLTDRSFEQLYLDNTAWATMEYKIGRSPDVPTDALSFANYHKSMREEVFLRQRAYDGADDDYPAGHGLFYLKGTEDLHPAVAGLGIEGFVDYVFLTGLRRLPTNNERNRLIDLARDRFWVREADGRLEWRDENRADDFAEAMFDYISRLPEFYYFRAVEQGSRR